MKIKKLFLLTIVVVFLGMVTACRDEPNSEPDIPPPTVVQGAYLVEKLQWIASNAANDHTYILEVSSDEFLNSHTLSYSGKDNISIQLTGIGSVKTIDLHGSGSLFTIENGVTLILNENIILRGKDDNNYDSLVRVDGGNLVLNNGSKITGNTHTAGGGGVHVSGGSFEKTGGIITGYSSDTENGNVVKYAGYVYTNRGHAVFACDINNSFIKRKETTAGQQDNLIYIGYKPAPTTISGAWDG